MGAVFTLVMYAPHADTGRDFVRGVLNSAVSRGYRIVSVTEGDTKLSYVLPIEVYYKYVNVKGIPEWERLSRAMKAAMTKLCFVTERYAAFDAGERSTMKALVNRDYVELVDAPLYPSFWYYKLTQKGLTLMDLLQKTEESTHNERAT